MITASARAFLNERRFAVLATINSDGSPHQTVMWYELIDDRIMVNTKVGRLKDANVHRDARISVCVEDDYHYVALSGRAEIDDVQKQAQADIARLARRYEDAETAERMIAEFKTQQRLTIWLNVEHIFIKGI